MSLAVKKVLQKALVLIESGWTKHAFETLRRGQKRYCIIGAIRESTTSTRFKYAAIQCVADMVPKRWRRASGYENVIRWQDSRGRRKPQVIALLKRSIAS